VHARHPSKVDNSTHPTKTALGGPPGYADDHAPDNKIPNVPLSEFFTLGTKRSFYQIPIPTGSPNESYFTNYTGQVEPDNED
jgi:hypothetical protein